MRLLSIARNPSRYVRIALAMLLLAFAADTIAHAAHTHDAQQPGTHSSICAYCVAFNDIVDAPTQAAVVPVELLCSFVQPRSSWQFVAVRSACSAQPRAPPFPLIAK